MSRRVAAAVVIIVALTVRGVRGADDQPDFLDEAQSLSSITILAKSTMEEGEPPLLVRFHAIPSAQVQIIYDDQARWIEKGLNTAPDYMSRVRKAPGAVTHYVMLPNHHAQYSVGGGANQLDIWESEPFAHYKFLEHAGIGISSALRGRWPAARYALDPAEDLSGPAGGHHRVHRVRRIGDKAAVVEEVHVYKKAAGPDAPVERLEYYNGAGVLTKSVANSDFVEVGHLLFPRRIEVSRHDGDARRQLHEIELVDVNPRLSPGLFANPTPAPGAHVFVHRLVNGKDEVSFTQIPALAEVEFAIQDQLDSLTAPHVDATAGAAAVAEPMGSSRSGSGAAPPGPPIRPGGSWLLYGAAAAALVAVIVLVSIARARRRDLGSGA